MWLPAGRPWHLISLPFCLGVSALAGISVPSLFEEIWHHLYPCLLSVLSSWHGARQWDSCWWTFHPFLTAGFCWEPSEQVVVCKWAGHILPLLFPDLSGRTAVSLSLQAFSSHLYVHTMKQMGKTTFLKNRVCFLSAQMPRYCRYISAVFKPFSADTVGTVHGKHRCAL